MTIDPRHFSWQWKALGIVAILEMVITGNVIGFCWGARICMYDYQKRVCAIPNLEGVVVWWRR